MRIVDVLRLITPNKIKEVLAYREFDEYSQKVYSQEGEDILLARIFDHKANGFYVDCGAHHPFRFSNTHLLSQKGWCGLNIDANPDIEDLFKKYRPNDIFVNVGLGRTEGVFNYYKYAHPALNTFDLKLVKERQKKPCDVIQIDVQSINTILYENTKQDVHIDLLNIDIEGKDLEVLMDLNLEKYRPSWIVAETQLSSVQEILQSQLCQYMMSNKYDMVCKLWKSIIFKDVNI